jgi:hypothetical protein
MLTTAWAITAVILPFAALQWVYLWPNQSVRLVSVVWFLALLWGIQELWEAQQWYQVAVAWQAAYWRDIGIAQQGCLKSSRQFQRPQSTAFAYDDDHCAVDQFHFAKGLYDSEPSETLPHGQLNLDKYPQNIDNKRPTPYQIAQQALPEPCQRTSARTSLGWPQAAISAEEILNYHIKTTPIPLDFI